MLPTAQHADTADRGLHDRKVSPVAFAEHRAFDVGGFELAARLHYVTSIVEQCLSDIQAAARPLAEADGRPNIKIMRRLCQTAKFRRINDEGVVVVALHVLHPS